MASSHSLISANVVFFLVITCSLAYGVPEGTYCNPASNIDTGGEVATNIAQLVADLNHAFNQGARFILSSYGKRESVVYGLAQCRGDVDKENCMLCIQNAGREIQRSCTGKGDAQIWYDHCFLRYSQELFFGKLDTSRELVKFNPSFAPNTNTLRNELETLFGQINGDAVKPTSGRFAAGQRSLPGSADTLYGMAMCTMDLSSAACTRCLNAATPGFNGNICSGRRGCKVLLSNCYVRYELYPFVNTPYLGLRISLVKL